MPSLRHDLTHVPQRRRHAVQVGLLQVLGRLVWCALLPPTVRIAGNVLERGGAHFEGTTPLSLSSRISSISVYMFISKFLFQVSDCSLTWIFFPFLPF